MLIWSRFNFNGVTLFNYIIDVYGENVWFLGCWIILEGCVLFYAVNVWRLLNYRHEFYFYEFNIILKCYHTANIWMVVDAVKYCGKSKACISKMFLWKPTDKRQCVFSISKNKKLDSITKVRVHWSGVRKNHPKNVSDNIKIEAIQIIE